MMKFRHLLLLDQKKRKALYVLKNKKQIKMIHFSIRDQLMIMMQIK